MKKLLAFVLAAIMALSVLPMTALAKNAEDNPGAYGYNETPASSVNVWVTISNDGYPIKGEDGTIISHLDVNVPYFDLGLYNLKEYYRYETENGQGKYVNSTLVKRPTVLHLYIYLLERYYMGLPESECGKGTGGLMDYGADTPVYYMDGNLAYNSEEFKALDISGSAMSLYMRNFWGHDENLMYYRNHLYPPQSEKWGSTADYILLEDGDSVDLAMFSNWSFWASGAFACFGKDTYKLKAGEKTMINVFKDDTRDMGDGGSETFTPFSGVNVALYDSNWKFISDEYTVDENGKLEFTAPQQAGTYYLLGTDPNEKTEDACIAPASAKIIVEDESEPEPEIIYGDINGDGVVDMDDVIEIIWYYNGITKSLTESQKKAADVNGDGTVDMDDVIEMIWFYNGIITKFSADKK